MRADVATVKDRILIRTDKNGTKYYGGWADCPRCGGAGGANCWKLSGWTCWQCGGSGTVYAEWSERTEEYQAKLDAKRIERQAKQIAYEEAHREELKREGIKKECDKVAKAIATCNERKGCGCDSCRHKVYCNLLSNVLNALEDGCKNGLLSDDQAALYERLTKIDRSEPVKIETLDGEPCVESRWFENAWGSSTRCITKPNGEKVYTSATTDRGLAKYGLRNRRGA